MATSKDNNGTALPCCCHRHDHSGPSVPVREVAQNAEDIKIWKTVLRFYQAGFVELVTRRKPRLAEWTALLRSWMKRPEPPPVDGDFGYRINFADMQRMHLRRLQAKLINIAMAIQFDDDKGVKGGAVGLLGPALHDYVQAIQDQEYMAKFSWLRSDPFIVSSERNHDNYLLQRAMNRRGKTASDWGDHSDPDNLVRLKKSATPTGPWEDPFDNPEAIPVENIRVETIRRALWSQIGGACVVGGVFLIGPMWLLVLKQELYLQLGATTVCVSAFGLLMAWYLDTLGAVFAATLGYAAVLMVFVGVVMENVPS